MFRRFLANFSAGIFALLPLLITLFVIGFLVGKVNLIIGPESGFGKLLKRIEDSWAFPLTFAYLLSVVFVIALIWVVGYITRKYAGRSITGYATTLVGRIPFINKIYHSAEQVVELFSKRDKDSVAALSNVVMVKIANIRVLGMLASSDAVVIAGERHFLVYLPSTPVPATGQNLLVPEHDIIDVDITVEEMTKILLSLGSLGPKILNAKPELAALAPPGPR